LNLRPLRPERGTTVRCRAIEHGRWHSEHDSGASSAVRWAWVCSFSGSPGFMSALEATDVGRMTDATGTVGIPTEVKTIRRKITTLAATGRADERCLLS
jgi:hypothetical protein